MWHTIWCNLVVLVLKPHCASRKPIWPLLFWSFATDWIREGQSLSFQREGRDTLLSTALRQWTYRMVHLMSKLWVISLRNFKSAWVTEQGPKDLHSTNVLEKANTSLALPSQIDYAGWNGTTRLQFPQMVKATEGFNIIHGISLSSFVIFQSGPCWFSTKLKNRPDWNGPNFCSSGVAWQALENYIFFLVTICNSYHRLRV